MPFKSKAQRRKIYELHRQGKITAKQLAEWEKDTPDNLPERAPGEPKVIIRRPRALRKEMKIE